MKSHMMTALAVGAMAATASAALYSGNGATGFGGPIGTGSGTLEITETAGNITFTLTPSSSLGTNKFVLYLDTQSGGIANTSALSDFQDFGRRLVSGQSSSNGRSTVNFASGFLADIGIAFDTGSFAPAFNIAGSTTNFAYVGGNSLGGSPYSVTLSRTALGLGATGGFNFVGSLLSNSVYRSNETYGTSSVSAAADAGGNPGFSNSITFSNSLTYVPEPASLALLGLGAVGMLRRRK